jgi:hypothetical protein
MTPIIKGRFTVKGEKGYIISEDGQHFAREHSVHHDPHQVGDNVWVARRTNVSKQDWCFDLYQITIQVDVYMEKHGHLNYPKTWLGRGRQIVIKI